MNVAGVGLAYGRTIRHHARPVLMTVAEWRKSIEESKPCPKCGCKLVEISEDGPMCANCCEPYRSRGSQCPPRSVRQFVAGIFEDRLLDFQAYTYLHQTLILGGWEALVIVADSTVSELLGDLQGFWLGRNGVARELLRSRRIS